MSADGKLGPRKLRQMEHLTGKRLAMAFVSHPYVALITADHRHLKWDRRLGALVPDEVESYVRSTMHWTSCPGGRHFDPTAGWDLEALGLTAPDQEWASPK